MSTIPKSSGKPLHKTQNILGISLLLLSCAGYYYLGNGLIRSQFPELMVVMTVLFASYGVLSASQFNNTLILGGAGLIFRILQFSHLPELSDDYFRFLWDGRLWVSGTNPFLYLPSELLGRSDLPIGINEALFARLNSPEYYTIYPPIAQFIYGLASWIFPDNDLGAVIVMRVFMVLGDVLAFVSLRSLLRHFRMSESLAFIYVLNPLVIIEFSGNLHFEGLMMGFILAALALLVRKRWLLSAVLFALGVSTKLVPLLFLPFLIRHAGWRISLTYFMVVAGVVLVLFTPFLTQPLIENFASSLDLYFQRFEFNASMYYLFRELGYLWKGYNVIQWLGPALSGVTFLVIMVWALTGRFGTRDSELATAWMGAHTIYLLLATVVHPWYIGIGLALMPLTRFRYVAVWSALAYLSYATYRTTDYIEDLNLVLIEYGIVFFALFWELSRKRKRALT